MAGLTEYANVLEEELTCSVCSDVFTDPRTLQCFHKFCFRCIAGWVERCTKDKQRASCPICKAEIDLPEGNVSKLRSSFYLDSLLQLLHAMRSNAVEEKEPQQDLAKCSSCEQPSKLVAFCPQCGGMICADCVTFHKTLKAFREDHQATMFSDFKQEHVNSYIKNQVHCQEKFHEQNKLEYYCQTCLKSICQKCAATAHSTHDKVSVEEAAEKAKQFIDRDMTRVRQLKQKYLQELELSKQNIVRYGNEIEAAKKEVRDATQAQMKILQDHELATIATLEKLFLDQKTANDIEQKEINSGITFISEFDLHSQTLQDQNVAHFILQSQQELPHRCETLLERPSILSSQPAKRNASVQYIPNPKVTQYLQDLGKIVENVTDPSRCSIESLNSILCGFVNEFVIVTRNVEGKVCLTNKSLIDVKIHDVDGNEVENEFMESGTGKYSVKYKAEKPSPYTILVSIGGKAIKNSPQKVTTLDAKADQFKPILTFGGEGVAGGRLKGPCAVALSNSGEVAIADYCNHHIVIYRVDGKFIGKLLD